MEIAQVKNAQAPRNKPHEVEEATSALSITRKCYRHLALDYVLQVRKTLFEKHFGCGAVNAFRFLLPLQLESDREVACWPAAMPATVLLLERHMVACSTGLFCPHVYQKCPREQKETDSERSQ